MAAPLQGVRIVEMGQLIAIPSAMKWLADMGAEVIRLESVQRLESYRTDSLYHNDVAGDFWNRGANFYEQNRNKLGLTLDLSRDEGRAVLRDLIAIADVFAENFTPRVVRNFGLEYDSLRRIRPDIIMVSSTGYGFDGPWANFGATGPATEGAAGLAYLTGYQGGGPVMSEIPYTDYHRRRAHRHRRNARPDAPPEYRPGPVHRRFPDANLQRNHPGGPAGLDGQRPGAGTCGQRRPVNVPSRLLPLCRR